jgi:zinc protease
VGPGYARAGAGAAVDPARASLVIVGDAKLFAAALKAHYPNAVIIPASRLDLDRADLTAPQ